MHMTKRFLLLSLLVLFGSGGTFQAQTPLGPDDIVALVAEGLADELIIRHIGQNGVSFIPDTAALIELKKSGASQEVLGAILDAADSFLSYRESPKEALTKPASETLDLSGDWQCVLLRSFREFIENIGLSLPLRTSALKTVCDVSFSLDATDPNLWLSGPTNCSGDWKRGVGQESFRATVDHRGKVQIKADGSFQFHLELEHCQGPDFVCNNSEEALDLVFSSSQVTPGEDRIVGLLRQKTDSRSLELRMECLPLPTATAETP